MRQAITIMLSGFFAFQPEAAILANTNEQPAPAPRTIEIPDRVMTKQLNDDRLQIAQNPCSQQMLDDVLEPALDGNDRVKEGVSDAVEINCDLTLQAGHVVTKRLVMTGPGASGAVIECNGATIRGDHWLTHFDSPRDTIVVRSERDESGVWHPAENISVHNCNIHGSVRVFGVAVSNTQLARMSYETDYTATLQAAGAKNIVFDKLNIYAYGRNPFYVMPGVVGATLKNSKIRGRSKGVAIYLDAESAENVIKDNDIGVKNKREQIAIDGSARNLIVGNRISGLNTGGIYLYRNCGERGVIRHQGAEDNVILDNVFYYNRYRGNTPAVWVASRQNDLPGYCDEDEGPDTPNIGSSFDHLDHAYRNVVARNRFIARDPYDLIKVHGDPTYIFDNTRVSSGGDRNSPCYVANGYPGPIVEHGASITLFDDGSGPRCNGVNLSCNDGALTRHPVRCPLLLSRTTVTPFECRQEGDNSGCESQAACPEGTSVVAAKVACNLEFGQVADTQLSRTPWSLAGVVKRSDKRSDGVCRFGSFDIGEHGLEIGALTSPIVFSCQERDRNGGDCHIRGALACRQDLQDIIAVRRTR